MSWPGVRELVGKAKAGDTDARAGLAALVRPFVAAEAAHPRFRFGPDWTAADLVQEALLRAVEKLPRFDGGADDAGTAAALRAWLKMVLRRVYLNRVRHETGATRRPPGSREPGLPEVRGDDPTPGTRAAAGDDHRRLAAALAALPDGDRRLIELHVFHGMTRAAAADALGLTESQFRTRWTNALAALRAALG